MWVGAILLTSILFSFNASTGCLDLLALVQKSKKSGRVAKKWPEERSGEHVRIFFKYLSSPPTTSLSSRKTVPRVKISNVKMSKCQNMRCRMVSHPSYIQTYSHSHIHTHIHTLIYTYNINTAPGLYLCIWPEVWFCTGPSEFRWWAALFRCKEHNLYNTWLVNFKLTPM